MVATIWKCRKCSGSEFLQYSTRKTCPNCLLIRKQKYKLNKSSKNSDLKKTYGIDLVQYESMLEKQEGKCAICDGIETMIIRGKVQMLSVDHCHSTGLIRGLLCHSCNHGLGKFKDDTMLLEKAIKYLEMN